MRVVGLLSLPILSEPFRRYPVEPLLPIIDSAEVLVQRSSLDTAQLLMTLCAHPPPMYLTIKRIMGLLLSAGALVVLPPVLAIIAVAIRLDSSDPAIYHKRWCGQFGKEFTMVSFRTKLDCAEPLALILVTKVDGPYVQGA